MRKGTLKGIPFPFAKLSRMRKSSILRLCVAALLLGGVWVAYTQAPQPAKLTTNKINDHLYVIHNDVVPGNTTALITNEGVLLVDDKFEIDHDGIMAELKKITSQPVKYVVNTHFHADHTGGNAKMQAMNVQVVASENARDAMVENKQPGLPNMVFQRHAHVYLGGKNVEMYYFGRSHTDGDIVVLFPEDRVLAAGDMFTFGDATPELIDYAGGGSAKEWTKTLDSALMLDFDTVVPGHGVITNKAEMRKFRDSTIALKDKVHEMIVEKKSKADVEKMLRTDFHWADLHVARGLNGLMAEMQ
jgi:cyclase